MPHHYSPPSFIYKSLRYSSPLYIPGSPRMERGPHGERCPYPETFLTYIPGSPVKELPPRPPPRSLFKERCFIPRAPFIQLSKSSADEPSSRFPKGGPYGKSCPSPEPFLYILQGPQQGSPPSKFPLQSSHRERERERERERFHRQSPFQPYLKVPGRWAHSRLPNWAPMKRDAHPQSLPFITLRALSKGAPPPTYPTRAPIERCPVSRAPFQLSFRVPVERTPHDT
jgi:hypothetical protein